jgi:hypothetical protein
MEKTFTPVDAASNGKLTILRPSLLAKEGVTGEVALGIYEGAKPNKFNEDKSDYFIRAENGDLTIINSTGSLARQMAKVAVGQLVRIVYNGMKIATKGKLQGKGLHSFTVETANDVE